MQMLGSDVQELCLWYGICTTCSSYAPSYPAAFPRKKERRTAVSPYEEACQDSRSHLRAISLTSMSFLSLLSSSAIEMEGPARKMGALFSGSPFVENSAELVLDAGVSCLVMVLLGASSSEELSSGSVSPPVMSASAKHKDNPVCDWRAPTSGAETDGGGLL
jgi:hypothetical protein